MPVLGKNTFTLPTELQKDLVGWEWFRPICKSATKTETYLERRCLGTFECSQISGCYVIMCGRY